MLKLRCPAALMIFRGSSPRTARQVMPVARKSYAVIALREGSLVANKSARLSPALARLASDPDSDGGEPAGDVLPPSGFYSLSTQTISDSCEPKSEQKQASGVEITVNSIGYNVPLAGGGREDVPWQGPREINLPGCESSFGVEVVSRTSHSIAVEYWIDWIHPESCKQSAFNVPVFDCSVRQRETFELQQSCQDASTASCH